MCAADTCLIAGSPSAVPSWMLIDIIFVYINKSDETETMKTCWNITHSPIVNGICDFFAELDKFWILGEFFFFFLAFHNAMATDMTDF